MKPTYHLFVPEWVPLANRGEEAIVRGMADVLFPAGNCDVHLLDQVDDYRFVDGIHVYPLKWFVSPWLNREFGLGLTWEKTRDSACSLARHALHGVHADWVKRGCRPLQATARRMRALADGSLPSNARDRALSRLMGCEFVLAGHDGGLDERVCHVIDVMKDSGREFGVFGVELRSSFPTRAVAEIHRATLSNARFFYCRTRASVAVAQEHFPEAKAELLPDPAFGMKPAGEDRIDEIVAQEGLAAFFQRPVVMVTACEPPPIARYAFEDVLSPRGKLDAHRRLFGELLRHIMVSLDVNLLFVPHALGPGEALDDRVVARDIVRRAQLPAERCRILTTECNARELKGLLARAELLIAERVHSAIGATGVHTPFLLLGSSTDRRIRGIVEETLGMGRQVYYLNRPSLGGLTTSFDDVWSRRHEVSAELRRVDVTLTQRLEAGALVMRRAMGVRDPVQKL